MSVEGRVALVTGGTGALGRAVVAELDDAGCTVHVPWIADHELPHLEERLGDRASAVTLHAADVGSEEQVAVLFETIESDSGRLDVLCNIVGGFVFASLADTGLDDWQRMLAMNATTAFLCCRAAAPLMRASGGGRIVNVTAMPAVERGAAQMSAYAASKAAVLNLTQSLAAELAGDHITVNAIAPSIIDTGANREAMPDADRGSWL